ncbi:helix-turn-helix domain-containing protein [Chryseobacterium sp. FH2]|uniref:helix-turn-helix domain-containing protein n=1 Tax=Chryseobacterium sp. FH2 TaxID=1674291 RepID=UPI001E64F7D4|nr:helix-turn-helix domain-containing protein [Chryseobacterium sp. FH2]
MYNKAAWQICGAVKYLAPLFERKCKNTTGLSVSQHIQNRIVLEAKRLLYHTDKSVKEISFELGYDDYPYFSRFFTKAAGMSALKFRSKRHR